MPFSQRPMRFVLLYPRDDYFDPECRGEQSLVRIGALTTGGSGHVHAFRLAQVAPGRWEVAMFIEVWRRGKQVGLPRMVGLRRVSGPRLAHEVVEEFLMHYAHSEE